MSQSPDRYREITASGPPRQLGREIGEALQEEIRGFCSVALDRVNKTASVTLEASQSVAAQSLDDARNYNPALIEELEGVAETSRVALLDLMLLQVRNQLTAESESGCTALSLRPCLVAQNWDNDPALDEFTVVLTRRPEGRPSLTTITQAGLIAYIGFNDAGIGACLNTLPAPCRTRGVPHYFTLRDLYEQRSLDDAAHSIRRAKRAIAANIILSTPQGPADLEVTIDNVHVLTDEVNDRVTHTNHCLHPALTTINEHFDELIQSYPRKLRIDSLLDQTEAPIGVEHIKQALRDHDGHPRSICRHPNDDPQTGFWSTVFSVIIEPAARRMHVSRGTPCDRPYEIYSMDAA